MSLPVKVFKRQKPTEEDKKTREDYRKEKNYQCEICGKITSQIHHRFPQQKVYWEDPVNYVLLDQWDCHRLVESNREHFIRDIKIHPNSDFYTWDKGKLYDYMRLDHRKIDEILEGRYEE